jgi:hypothetical protein
MVKCARCDSDVDTVQTVTPDVVTKERIDSIDYSGEDFTGEASSMDVCAECMAELTPE